MALLPTPVLDLTNKDFASLRLRLQGLARSVTPEWTDFNNANFGNVLLEMMAYVGDNIMFYVDAQAREMFWPTLTRRISAIRQGRLINFELDGAHQASGVVRISIPTPLTKLVPVPLGTKLRSVDPITPLLFRTTDDGIALPIGQTFVDINVEQTELISGETFESTGAPNQEFSLARIPYLDDSVTVVAGDGTYTPIQSFTEVTSTDTRKFVVVVDQNDRARIRFGNGLLGKVPEGSITVSYKLSQGANGNVEAGSVRVVLDTLLDSDGDTVSGVIATNPLRFSGGTDRMSIAQARSLAPASLRALTRSVKNSDFETNAKISGVARALMLTSNQDISVLENNGVLLIVALGSKLSSGKYLGAAPSPNLLDEVRDEILINKPPTTTFALSVQGAVFKTINVSARIYLNQGAVTTTVKSDVTSSLQDFFAVANKDGTPNTAVDFGANLKNSLGVPIGEIAWSDVINAVRDVPGIRKVDEGPSGLLLNSLRQSITIGLREFPQLGSVTLINADTGLTL